MYGLPQNFDGSFLIGRTFEMVCFSQNQVYLHLDEKITITVESAFSYKTDQPVSVPIHFSNLMELLGTSVSEVKSSEDGTLSLLLDNGQMLKVYDTSKQFESYIIAYGDKVIIV